VREASATPVKIRVATKSGQPVANLTAPAIAGVNRVAWDLMPSSDVLVPYGSTGRKFVPSGDYVVTVTHGAATATDTVSVRIPPGVETR
jgi:hypothetical protein